jgi:hypothetical protein
MGLQGRAVSITNAVTLGNNSPTTALYSLPTLNVSAGGSVSLTGAQCVNFQTGAIAVVLQRASLVNATYLFVNTSNRGVVALSLDNGGTIGGLAVYNLVPGQATTFTFDGTNLNQNPQFS